MAKIKLLVYIVLLLLPLTFCEDKPEVDDATSESVYYESPWHSKIGVYLAEHFDDPSILGSKWIKSNSKKPNVDEELAQYDGKWSIEELERFPLKNDKGLVLASESRHAAISSKLDKPFKFESSKTLVIQYEVAFQKPHTCGGAYLKLLTDGPAVKDLTQFNDKTPYSIMFGPDKCGPTSKVHFIIRHKNPKNNSITEKHCLKLKTEETVFTDHQSHLFTLIIKPDNSYSFFLDQELQYEGDLLSDDDFSPPINPPKEIVDKNDVKPEDWDERAKIPDESAVKPDDWDESEPENIPDESSTMPSDWLENESTHIPDASAIKPSDWDNDMDGEWEPPLINNQKCEDRSGCGPWTRPLMKNPKYKGKWKQPLIDNPNYRGKWSPRLIENPDYFYDKNPLKSSPIGAIGFELWSISDKIYFDNIIITDDEAQSTTWAENSWSLKKKNLSHKSESVFGAIIRYTNEYPWLWAVYVVFIAVAVVLLVIACSSSSKEKNSNESNKKTDEPVPDIEGDVSDEEQEAEVDIKEDEEIDGKSAEDEEENVDIEADQTNEEQVPSSPRKRRTRKD
ncbi:Concanavalin A-like lectin/glucanase domain,Calreticulin/calnexin, conserved [Cinara cedri]|uniref:Concanavalin A-like lectin/glucanase domain,Calreticulin/calnexin, conserved n=1 Tax=Cinara cedri TaxID=506608 RepID=A0A5E4MQ25_9HEMI|nr:Concanavalin A-like lectin/glucanase domain,Calreticulin/calnexin, conserved [Cinara cedri]